MDASGGGRLLVADDSPENREVLKRHLKVRGYQIETAEDGEQAWKMLEAGGFDMLLLDLMMPIMDGFEVLKKLKADPVLRDMPVVMLSALEATASVARCIRMGAEDYLTKPFDPVLLGARIKASLEKKWLRDQEKTHTEELQKTLDELRHTQNQLLVQEKLASLGALTAGIAHEIKNPLNFVTNFAGATRDVIKQIREQGATPELIDLLDQYTGKIEEHGRRADRIVRGMLLHSRGKSGQPETVELNSLVKDCLDLAWHGMRAQDRDFNVAIQTDFDASAGAIRAVPQDLNRAFLNIINNACYAAHERKKQSVKGFAPLVAVSTAGSEEGVEVRVRDNGNGIPPELLPRIFEPFFTTKPAGSGSGLGLSLSHDIVVERHHGAIRAMSEPGCGAEFIVSLPRSAI